MNKTYVITCLFSLFLLGVTVAQDNAGHEKLKDSKDLMNKGIELYDNEDYEAALEEFKQIYPYDSNYTWALYEMSLAYYKLKDFKEAERCARKVLKLKQDYVDAYTSLGNALDEQGRLEEALAVYDSALAIYPYNHLLWLNKGILYEQDEQYDKAFEIYKELISFNPMFSSTHLRLGLMCLNEGLITQGMLSLTTFLMLEPASGRSLNILSWLNVNASGGNKDLGSAKVKKLPSEMSDIDFLVNNKIALNKKYKIPSKFNYNILRQMHLIFEQLAESPGSGYWWDLYAPVYTKLMQEERYEMFSLYLLASSTDEKVKKAITKKLSSVKDFGSWFVANWHDLHEDYSYDGEAHIAYFYNSSALMAFSHENSEGKTSGKTTYFYSSGNRSSMGELDENANRTGLWYFFYDNGDTSQIAYYNEGKLDGEYRSFYANGVMKEHSTYKEGSLEGKLELFYPSGQLRVSEHYTAGKLNGKGLRYHASGVMQYEYEHKDGELNGVLKEYYANGGIKDDKVFAMGKLNGERKQYYENGQVSHIQQYTDGELEGPYETYYMSGQMSSKGMVVKGTKSGNWEYYYSDGTLSEKSAFDESGKLTGKEENFAYDGKLLSMWEYVKGEPKSMTVVDAEGKTIYTASQSKGTIYLKNYSGNRVLATEGPMYKDNYQGLWKVYFDAGVVSYEKNYEEGKLQGDYKSYYRNGELEYNLNFTDDMADGYYERKSQAGNITTTGMYYKNEKWGHWKYYLADGSMHEEAYMADGKNVYRSSEYYLNGKLMNRHYYDSDGLFIGYCDFDTNGALMDSVSLEYGYGDARTKFSNGKPRWSGQYVGGSAHGKFAWYYPNGKLSSEGEYRMGDRVGLWQWNFPDGSKKESGSYENGYKQGEWNSYYLGGTLVNLKSHYRFGKLHGLRTSYYASGEVEYEIEYDDDDRHGESRYYAPSGELKIVRYYVRDFLIGYAYMGKDGKLKPMIPVENETAEITAYYANGKKSVSYTFDRGMFQGEFTHYLPNGELQFRDQYTDNVLQGENIRKFGNGKVSEQTNYIDGELHGTYKVYYPNGKIRISGTYYYGEPHGEFVYYSSNGTKLVTLLYNTGVIVVSE